MAEPTGESTPSGQSGLFNRIRNTVQWKPGLTVGIIAFVAVLGLVSVAAEVDGVLAGEESDVADDPEFEDEPGFLTPRIWALFGTHFVDIEATATTGLGGVDMTFDVIDEYFTEIPSIVFYLIPMLILVLSGYLLASRYGELEADSETFAIIGGSVAVGYLPLVFFSILFFDFSTEADGIPVTYEPQLLEGLLFAGLLFPIVFGALGGYLAFKRVE